MELKNHIFVHSWIPIKETDCGFEFDNNWRNADKSSWDNARWYNPFLLAKKGLLPEKTLVFGHWHCSAGHKMLGNCDDEFNYAIWEPCYFKNTIGIARTVPNVVTIAAIPAEEAEV